MIKLSVCVIVCAHSNDISVVVWNRQYLWGSEISLWAYGRSSASKVNQEGDKSFVIWVMQGGHQPPKCSQTESCSRLENGTGSYRVCPDRRGIPAVFPRSLTESDDICIAFPLQLSHDYSIKCGILGCACPVSFLKSMTTIVPMCLLL